MSGDGKGKTVLVTGGGGYIGSHCVHELLVEDYDVVAIDNFANSVPGIHLCLTHDRDIEFFIYHLYSNLTLFKDYSIFCSTLPIFLFLKDRLISQKV